MFPGCYDELAKRVHYLASTSFAALRLCANLPIYSGVLTGNSAVESQFFCGDRGVNEFTSGNPPQVVVGDDRSKFARREFSQSIDFFRVDL